LVLRTTLRRSLGNPLIWSIAALLGSALAKGGPLDELKSLAQLPQIDLATLKSGEIVTQRGPLGDFSRGIHLESSYFIHAPVAAVGDLLLHWDPTQHRERKVRLYREYRWPAIADVFKSLRLTSSISEDRWLLDHTLAIAEGAAADDLHLTAGEVDLVRQAMPKTGGASAQSREARANEVWQEILRRRSDSLERGGFATIAPYGSDASVSPGSEFRGLLSLAPKAAKHFRLVVSAKPMVATASIAVDEVVGYWQTTQVRNHTTLQLGVFAAHKSADSWQLLDCVYYPSDTYFMALDLFQLWPLDGGTLVWQVGFVSAPFRSYLGGVDRFVAGKQMTQETLDTIKAFRSDIEERR